MPQEKINAPMACTVVEVCVGTGETVAAGQTLLILEAMKMEHEVRAPRAAQVTELLVAAGDQIAEGELLMRLGAASAGSSRAGEGAAPAPPTLAAEARGERAALR